MCPKFLLGTFTRWTSAPQGSSVLGAQEGTLRVLVLTGKAACQHGAADLVGSPLSTRPAFLLAAALMLATLEGLGESSPGLLTLC